VSGTGPIIGINPVTLARVDLDRAVDRLIELTDAGDDNAVRTALLEIAVSAAASAATTANTPAPRASRG